MDFYVVLERPGYRVAKRRQRLAKVGVQHRVTKEDSIKWFQVGLGDGWVAGRGVEVEVGVQHLMTKEGSCLSLASLRIASAPPPLPVPADQV